MRKKPKVCLLTTDGQMIEIYDKAGADALYQECIVKSKHLTFIQINHAGQTRFIPTLRIKEIIFYDTKS